MCPDAGHVAPFHRALRLHPRLAALHRHHFARMAAEIIAGGIDPLALARETPSRR